jgi:hypothetical protein
VNRFSSRRTRRYAAACRARVLTHNYFAILRAVTTADGNFLPTSTLASWKLANLRSHSSCMARLKPSRGKNKSVVAGYVVEFVFDLSGQFVSRLVMSLRRPSLEIAPATSRRSRGARLAAHYQFRGSRNILESRRGPSYSTRMSWKKAVEPWDGCTRRALQKSAKSPVCQR